MGKRKRTTSNSKNERRMKDWISQLPDDVIGVIVSHLTLKEAGRTSVLSHRWRNMWTFTRHFNFDAMERMDQIDRYLDSTKQEWFKDVIEGETERYIRWVAQVVENHRGSDLDELVVAFGLDKRYSLHLDKWISFAVRKRVKVIKIELGHHFRGRSGRYSFVRSAPNISGIECLTSLSLSYVDITGEMIEHLLSACPLLERLYLDDLSNLLNLRVVSSSLKLKYLYVGLCPLESVEISAPNLTSFHYRKPLGKNTKLQVADLNCLIDLYIGTFSVIHEFVQFSSYFFQLETLTLDCPYVERFLVLLGRTKLTNLKHLTLKIKGFESVNIDGLAKLICLCPVLHKFTLELFDLANKEDITTVWGQRCLYHSLKVVEMNAFVGQKHEIKIAKFFLKNAVNLEKLVIDTHCEFLALDDGDFLMNTVAPGSRERAERLRRRVPPGVELLIL